MLVVDDEEVVRRGFAEASPPSSKAHTATDGADALQAIARRPADVVLLDLRMPGAQGLEILKAMKQKWPRTEVVIITGYPECGVSKGRCAPRRRRLSRQAGRPVRNHRRDAQRAHPQTLDAAHPAQLRSIPWQTTALKRVWW